MKMRPDQERVRNLLLDTVTLLCKNGLDYKREMKVQGLIGITIDDDDVFLVHFDELSELPGAEDTSSTTAEVSKKKKRSSDVIDLDLSGGPQAAKQQKLMDDGVMNNPMSKRLDLSSSLRQSHPDVKPKIKEEKLEDCVVLDDQFEDSKANIVGDFELENASNLNQMAALSGFPHGSSPAGAGGGGRGAPPGGPMSAQFFPGQPGAPVPPDMSYRQFDWYNKRTPGNGRFKCTYEDCDKSFKHVCNLRTHEVNKHGRRKKFTRDCRNAAAQESTPNFLRNFAAPNYNMQPVFSQNEFVLSPELEAISLDRIEEAEKQGSIGEGADIPTAVANS